MAHWKTGHWPLKDDHHELLDGGVRVDDLLGLGHCGGKGPRKGP